MMPLLHVMLPPNAPRTHVDSTLYGLPEMNVEGTWEDIYSEYLDPLTLIGECLDEYETDEESDAESEDGRANPQEA